MDDDLRTLDRWWRAANYLAVGQIYLMGNPLLRRPLQAGDVKPRLLGHWGTTPGLNLLYAHANRVIRARDLDAIMVMGPGHGGPSPNACSWLEGTYTERYPAIERDEQGMGQLFRQFSFPGGVPSHCAPNTPGSIHEGGELGYSLLHAFGAVWDRPGLTTFCVVGDGEAETGPLAASWHVGKFLNPVTDGAVLPILHLNGWKIANPTVLARLPEEELLSLLAGYGYAPRCVTIETTTDHLDAHRALADAMDGCLDEIAAIQEAARSSSSPPGVVTWPMIVLRSPKGWTGPAVVDGEDVEGTYRAHQVPIPSARDNDDHRAALEAWMRSYAPEELFDDAGTPAPDLLGLPPSGPSRMSDNPVANGGLVARDLELPDFRDYGVDVTHPGEQLNAATTVLGGWVRDVVDANRDRFLLLGPDEVASNRLSAVFEVTGRRWLAATTDEDDHLAADGRVVEVLSEHLCQGILEGYLLTGRHGLFTTYEAFTHIVDSMFNQHAKWIEAANDIPWRRPIPSLTYLLTSHVWRQDHNGATHQDPGFLDVVMNKKPAVVRAYLPPDTNCLLSVADHCLRSRNYVNVIVAGKQTEHDYLTVDQAIDHCARGVGIWDWASSERPGEPPDVVMACAGDVPTLEALAATDILREHLPDLAVRFVNVVDLTRLLPAGDHPHGMTDAEFDTVFTTDRPVIFAFHGYPWLVHRLTYKRTNHDNVHVRGYEENGTTTTPYDMVLVNDLDRHHLVMDVIDRVPGLRSRAAGLRQRMVDTRFDARRYTREHGEDPPEIAGWCWGSGAGRSGSG